MNMSSGIFHIEPGMIQGERALLTGDELRHARLVLRLAAGDTVTLLDGQGGIYEALIAGIGRREASLAITSRREENPPPFRITVAMGIVRGERFDWAIRKGCELGAVCFVPLVTERVEDRADGHWRRLDRLGKVVVAACKQCERARFPDLREPVPLEDLEPDGFDLSLAFWESPDVPSIREATGDVADPVTCLMVVGPVGGFTRKEAETMAAKGFKLAGMGPRILRTETAVAAGIAILQNMFGDMG